jgi:hypothetical protein
MAIPKSTRSSPGSTRSRRSVLPHRLAAAVTGSEAASMVFSVAEFRRLSLLVRRFRTIYGTALTAELALRHQAAEQDSEVADCLRGGVCDPIADQVRELEDLILQFCTTTPGGKP